MRAPILRAMSRRGLLLWRLKGGLCSGRRVAGRLFYCSVDISVVGRIVVSENALEVYRSILIGSSGLSGLELCCRESLRILRALARRLRLMWVGLNPVCDGLKFRFVVLMLCGCMITRCGDCRVIYYGRVVP